MVANLAAALWLILAIIIIAHPLSAGRPDGRLHVEFLDVGQGDAALLTIPDGTTILVDGGGRPAMKRARVDVDAEFEGFERDSRSIGEAVVSEYLWWRGLDSVDYVLATHADADHIEGLNDVARNFKVRGALVARAPADDLEYARFSATMREYQVPVQILVRGDSLRFGAVRLDVLWPERASDANAPSRNNDSLVVRLRFGERVILLTGDIEAAAETKLAAAPAELRCDVIKVAHHGSKTSSTEGFVNAARPSYAIISVGLFSNFGHPDQAVVERWRKVGAQVLTTGRSGTIAVSTNGQDLRVETYVPQ